MFVKKKNLEKKENGKSDRKFPILFRIVSKWFALKKVSENVLKFSFFCWFKNVKPDFGHFARST